MPPPARSPKAAKPAIIIGVEIAAALRALDQPSIFSTERRKDETLGVAEAT
jgi:hypothetical protein